MFRLQVFAFTLAALLVMAGCGRQPLPANQNPPKDQADLKARYERLEIGIPELEIAAFMGKAGAEVAGYSTEVVKRKPQAGARWRPASPTSIGRAPTARVRSGSFLGRTGRRD